MKSSNADLSQITSVVSEIDNDLVLDDYKMVRNTVHTVMQNYLSAPSDRPSRMTLCIDFTDGAFMHGASAEMVQYRAPNIHIKIDSYLTPLTKEQKVAASERKDAMKFPTKTYAPDNLRKKKEIPKQEEKIKIESERKTKKDESFKSEWAEKYKDDKVQLYSSEDVTIRETEPSASEANIIGKEVKDQAAKVIKPEEMLTTKIFVFTEDFKEDETLKNPIALIEFMKNDRGENIKSIQIRGQLNI